jgi:hypothetical protein
VTDPTPAALAEQAAEAIRALNHATIRGGGYTYPSDVDRVIGSLTTLAQRLPQALRQAGQWLADQDCAGRIGDDRGGDPGLVVMEASSELANASHAAESLARVLARSSRLTARMTSTGGDPS